MRSRSLLLRSVAFMRSKTSSSGFLPVPAKDPISRLRSAARSVGASQQQALAASMPSTNTHDQPVATHCACMLGRCSLAPQTPRATLCSFAARVGDSLEQSHHIMLPHNPLLPSISCLMPACSAPCCRHPLPSRRARQSHLTAGRCTFAEGLHEGEDGRVHCHLVLVAHAVLAQEVEADVILPHTLHVAHLLANAR